MNWYRIKEAMNWIVIVVVAAGVLVWAWQQDQGKETIVIATASEGGYYYEFGNHLAAELKRIAGERYDVEVRVTKGSVNNSELLRKGDVDVGILAIGSVSLQNLDMVAPLWKDYSHIVKRRTNTAEELKAFEGQRLILGVQKSGYRAQAQQLLDFFGVDSSDMDGNDQYFKQLLNDDGLQGAIVTTGLLNPDLRDVLFTGEFELMPVAAADGFAFNHVFHSPDFIPAGVYPSINGPIPTEAVPTISTMAVMAASRNINDDKVSVILEALNSSDLRGKAPVLLDIDPTIDPVLKLLSLHSVSQQFYNPNFGLNIFSDAMATLDSLKEIILLLIILLVAVFVKYRDSQHKKDLQRHQKIASQLFSTFEDLLKIERTLKETSDIRLLKQYEFQVLSHKQQTISMAKSAGLEVNDVYLSVLNECNELTAQITTRLQQARTKQSPADAEL